MNQASVGGRISAKSMYQSFDAFEYVDYLRRRWRVAAVACGVAMLLSLPLSLLMPKRYTATASIVIEPPGNTDARTAIVISPMYLESLKTYERFADSDSLFARAAEKFHLQEAGGAARPIESLKRGVLKVSKLRDTKIMEISVTLDGPQAGAKRGAVSGRGDCGVEPRREPGCRSRIYRRR